MIACRGVRYGYGPEGFALEVDRLEIPSGLTLLLGPNGSGKSTLLRLLAGVERPERGEVLLDDRDAWTDEVAARAFLAYVPEHPDLTPYASVDDVLRLVARMRGLPTSTADAALARAGLTGVARRSIRELSMGQRRRAMFAAAFVGEPRIALVDEPLETLDREMRGIVLEWITRLVASEATVVVATHETEPFASLATRAIRVVGGRPHLEPWR